MKPVKIAIVEGDKATINVANLVKGEHIAIDPSKNIDIARNGEPPADIQQIEGGFIATWPDGFFVVLQAEGELPEGDIPRQVSINSTIFDLTGEGSASVDEFMQWVALYNDNPLDFAPLPPYDRGFELKEEDDRLIFEEDEQPPPQPEAAAPEPEAELSPVILPPPPEDGLPIIEPSIVLADDEDAGSNEGGIDDLPGADAPRTGTLAGVDYGPDGPGDIALAPSTDTGLRTLDGGVIQTSWDAATHTLTGFVANAGPGGVDVKVFTLDLAEDGTGHATADYVFTMLQSVAHPSPGVVEEDVSFATTATITDANGTTAQAEVTIIIDDDTPVAFLAAPEVPGVATLDESVGDTGSTRNEPGQAQPFDELGQALGVIGYSIAPSAILFDASGVSAGADGEASRVFGLVLTAPAGDSSLRDTATGNGIYLFQELNGDITGRVNSVSDTADASGEVAFRIIVNPDTGGAIILQFRAVVHGDTTDHDDGAGSSNLRQIAPGLVQIQLTLTDGDGDTVTSNAVELGSVFRFEDDGPVALLADAATDTFVLDETRPVDTETDGDSNPAGLDTATANFADNFAAITDFGSDGDGGTVFALVLNGTNVPSGLYSRDASDTTLADSDGIGQGQQIVLNQAGNTVTGSVGATNYFTISVDPNTGVVTFTQINNIWHPNTASDDEGATLTLSEGNLLTLTQTITDGDGDSDTAAINLGTGVFTIQDDGPDAVVANATADTLVLDETRPVGTDTDGVAPAGLDTVTAIFADNFAAVTDYGSDGPGSTVYGLVLTGTNVASGLFALDPADITLGDADGIGQGTQIVLNQSGNTVTGSVGATNYFTISVDPNTGVVTFTQLNNIWHPTTSNDDEGTTLTLGNANLLTLTQTVTDADGDSDNAAINLGTGVFTIQDDGPDAVVANATADTLVLDETRPVGTDTDGVAPAGLDTVTANFADNFAAVTDYGSDGPGSTAYGLVLTGTNVASGLYALDAADTTLGDSDGIGQGTQIVLNQSGNSVTGLVGATNYFTISVDPDTGVITFTQLNNIWHPTTSNDDEGATLTLGNANLLTLTQTVTDADGDSDTAAINLGTGVFTIQDDGPDAVVANATADTLVLDETRPVGTDTDGVAPPGLDTVTANFADNFAAVTDYGSDGPGSTVYGLVLTGTNVASGLFALDPADVTLGDSDDIGQGTQIVLNQSGNTVTGSVGATNYFTISVDSNTGVLTFTQLNNIWHPTTSNDDEGTTLTLGNANLLTLTQTVTDADGDSDTAAINLGTGVFTIQDDGPDAVVTNATADTLVLDETRPVGTDTDGVAPAGLDTVTANFADNFAAVTDYGSDGPGSTVYGLVLTGTNVASGLFALDPADTTLGDSDGIGQGTQIVLNQSGNTVTGSVGATNYFTITVAPATGVVTFTQLNNIWHPTTSNDDEGATLTLGNANLLTLTQTVTDADGDSDTAAINLGTGVFTIQDDGPDAVVANATADTLVLDETRPMDTDTDGVAPAGLDTVTANFADNFAAVTDYGSDGPGSTVYGLILIGTNVASGLYALDPADTTLGDSDGIGQGTQIVLNQSGNTVTGSVGATNYFTISVAPATGVVTFTQLNNIWHPTTSNDDEGATLTLGDANLLTLTQTITDADGDSDTAAINLGTGVFTIQDDGPDAVVTNATADTLVLDETRPVGTDTDGVAPAGLDTVTANFADNFAAITDYGSDGPGSTVYGLVLTGTNVASGLFALDPTDTTLGDSDGIGQGTQIVLNQAGNTVTGSVGATNYFTISIAPTTGVVTFTQINNIWHATTSNDDEGATLTLANANLLTLTQTVTDADGDNDTAAINLGTGVFTIQDDGPDAVVANATADTLVLDETRPVGTDTDGIAPAGLDTVTANLADNFAAVTDYGSDGPGSTVYGLMLTGTNVASGLYALDSADTTLGDSDGIGQGTQIVLNQSGNTVTGSVGATNYFTISVDPNTGVVTLTQLNNIWHPTTSNDDEGATLTLGNANLLTLTQTVTDADGDSDTAAINLGTGVFTIQDDGPDALVANSTADTLVLDETRPVGTDTDGVAPAGLDTVTANFADNFAAVTDYGSDGPGSTVYGLVLTGTNVASGLYALDPTDTTLDDSDGIGQGTQIVLNQAGNTVTGSVGATNYFTISIAPATGVVTFTQLNNIWHPTTSNDDEGATLTLGNANLLTLTQTVTDADGDSDTAAINLGTGVFTIQDDGPYAVVANATADTLVLDETRPVGTDTDGVAPAGLDIVTADFADNFAAVTDYGSDGPGSTVYGLVLTGTNVASGLFALDAADTTLGDADGIGQGSQIVLNQSGNTVTGSVGATNYFTISIAPTTGVVTFTQLNNIWHPTTGNDDEGAPLTLGNANLLTLTQTVTDADGDSDTAAINLGTGVFTIQDDGPSVTSNSIVQLDDDNVGSNGNPGFQANTTDGAASDDVAPANTSGILAHNFGTDGGTIAYLGTGAPSGFSYEFSGSNLLVKQGLTTVLTLTLVAATGAYTVTQNAPILHDSLDGQAGDDEENDQMFTINYRVTDVDGDTADGLLTINVDDDSPKAFVPQSESLINLAGSNSAAALPLPNLDGDGNIDNNVGADQNGTVAFANISNGQQAVGVIGGNTLNLTSGGQNIQLFLVDHDSNGSTPLQLQGWTGGLNTGTMIFTVTLNHDTTNATDDTYAVALMQQIGATQQHSITDFSSVESGNLTFKTLNVAGTTQDLLFSGYDRANNDTTSTGTINTSSTGIGVNNQSMNDGENLRIDFVNSPSVTGGGDHTYDYTTHYTVNSFRFTIVQVNGSPPADAIETWVRVYNADDDDPDPPGDTTAVHSEALADDPQLNTITDIKVNGVSLSLGLLTTDGAGGYLVRGLDLNDQVLVTTSGGYNRIEIENARSMTAAPDATLDGESFDIGGFAFETTITNVPSVNITFDLALSDADGDKIIVDDGINITLTAPLPPVVLDLDHDGVEFVSLDQSHAHFDFNGDRMLEKSAWVNGDDGILVHDANGDRTVNDSSEIAFANLHPDATTDLQGLKLVFDSNSDGVLDAQDDAFGQFGIWQDLDGDGTTDQGEYHTLAEAGIASLNLATDGNSYTTADGDALVFGEGVFTYVDGSEGLLADVALGSIPVAADVSTEAGTFAGDPPALEDMLTPDDSVEALLANAASDNSSNSDAAAAPAGTDVDNDAPAELADNAPAGDAPADAPAAAPDEGSDHAVACVPETVAPVEEPQPVVA